MPTYYTKTISSILDPVAEQVSLLVILNEEAAAAVVINDLMAPITAVKKAIINLTDIGTQTYKSSNDELLKRDMPLALKRVEKASEDLLQAADILKTDSTSLSARDKIIAGSRGILQGTTAVLVIYDMSEVRIIINKCNNVKLFINETELVRGIGDLTTFIKNLAPLLTSMTKMTLERAEELTVKAHADILVQSVDQIRQCTALLLSSLKMMIITNEEQENVDKSSLVECRLMRNSSVLKLLVHIQEVIRVLQLTNEPELTWWESRQCSIIRQCKTTIDSRSCLLDQWIFSCQDNEDSLCQAAVNDLIENLEIMSSCCDDDVLRNDIIELYSDLKLLSYEIYELRRKGEDSSETMLDLIDEFRLKYAESLNICDSFISDLTKASTLKIPRSYDSRLTQSKLWLLNPEGPDRNEGVVACISLVDDANETIRALQKFSKNQPLIDSLTEMSGSVKSETNDLNNKIIFDNRASSDVYQLSSHLLTEITLLTQDLFAAVIDQVSENFLDLKSSIRQISKASIASKHEPNRAEDFYRARNEFLEQSAAICSTAALVESLASEGQQTGTLALLADEIDHISTQVVSAGYLVLMNYVDNCPQSLISHFNVLQNDWKIKVENLTNEIDKFTDIKAFVETQDYAIEIESEIMENRMRTCSPQTIVDRTSMIARRANRIAQKTDVELSLNEDSLYVDNLSLTVTRLRHSITDMTKAAKHLMMNLSDQEAIDEWRQQNDNLRRTVQSIKSSVSAQFEYSLLQSVDKVSVASNGSPKENDIEDRFDFPAAQPNQPILAAAHVLHRETRQWSSKNNDIITAAKRMANLMAKLSQLVRGEQGSKRELIDVAREIAHASEEVTKFARKLGEACTDIRIKDNLLQVCDRIPTIGTQLRIISTVKATMLGTGGSDEDRDATDTLVGNAQNLMQSVIETVRAAEAASIKLRIDSGYTIRWSKKTSD